MPKPYRKALPECLVKICGSRPVYEWLVKRRLALPLAPDATHKAKMLPVSTHDADNAPAGSGLPRRSDGGQREPTTSNSEEGPFSQTIFPIAENMQMLGPVGECLQRLKFSDHLAERSDAQH